MRWVSCLSPSTSPSSPPFSIIFVTPGVNKAETQLPAPKTETYRRHSCPPPPLYLRTRQARDHTKRISWQGAARYSNQHRAAPRIPEAPVAQNRPRSRTTISISRTEDLLRRVRRRQLGPAAPRISSVRITSLPRRQPIISRAPRNPRQTFVGSAIDRSADRARHRPCKSTVNIFLFLAPVPSRLLSGQPRSTRSRWLHQTPEHVTFHLPGLPHPTRSNLPSSPTRPTPSCLVTGVIVRTKATR